LAILSSAATAQGQGTQYLLGRLDDYGHNAVFDTELPADVADYLTGKTSGRSPQVAEETLSDGQKYNVSRNTIYWFGENLNNAQFLKISGKWSPIKMAISSDTHKAFRDALDAAKTKTGMTWSGQKPEYKAEVAFIPKPAGWAPGTKLILNRRFLGQLDAAGNMVFKPFSADLADPLAKHVTGRKKATLKFSDGQSYGAEKWGLLWLASHGKNAGKYRGHSSYQDVSLDTNHPQFKDFVNAILCEHSVGSNRYGAGEIWVAISSPTAPPATSGIRRAVWSLDALKRLQAIGQLAGRPFDTQLQPSSHPRVVPLAAGNTLYLCWQDPGAFKIHLHMFNGRELSRVGQGVPSLGMLGGFTRDASGNLYVLTNIDEFPTNNGKAGDDVKYAVTWDKLGSNRANRVMRIVKLNKDGAFVSQQDLNTKQYAEDPYYGLQNWGTARLVMGNNGPVGLCSRRLYTSGDKVFHQGAGYFELDKNLKVPTYHGKPMKAARTVSHSLGQRAIADGDACVFLHNADSYPSVGLLIQKYKDGKLTTRCAYTCPTKDTATHVELGGIQAEPKGYVVLFATPRHRKHPTTVPADLAMVHVVKSFETKDQQVPRTLDLRNKKEPTTIDIGQVVDSPEERPSLTYSYRGEGPEITLKRKVVWLTDYRAVDAAVKRPKLAKLSDTKFVAIWEKWSKAGVYDSTWALAINEMGTIQAQPKMIGHMRLNLGDDAFTWNGKAAWVTGDAVQKKFVLHTLDQNLTYAKQDLAIP